MIQLLQDGDFSDEVFVKLWLLNELLLVDDLDSVLLPCLRVERQLHSGKVAGAQHHLREVILLIHFSQFLVVLKIPMLLGEVLIDQDCLSRLKMTRERERGIRNQ